MFDPKKPYNDLPHLPPDQDLLRTTEIYEQLTTARAALAELKGRLPIIPNPLMLINTLVLQEAKDSSTIENIVTSSDKLYRAFTSNNPKIDSHTKEVLRYREALWGAFNSLKIKPDWVLGWIIKIFKTITEKDEEIRTAQVYLGNPSRIVYTPPEPGEVLNEKLENWIEYAQTVDKIDPLIRMSILHYQFESIHPFSDGNGRTGRILNVLYLTSRTLLDLPVLYLSKYILEYKSEYYRLFRGVTENDDWTSWILFMLKAIEETSMYTLEKINAISELFNQTITDIKSADKSIYSYELVEILFSQPYCNIQILVDHGIASRNTASKYLKRLSDLGFLKSVKEGKETLYLNESLYDILSQN